MKCSAFKVVAKSIPVRVVMGTCTLLLYVLINCYFLHLCVIAARHFATGSADAICSLWDVSELVCIQTFSRLEYVHTHTCNVVLLKMSKFVLIVPYITHPSSSSSSICSWPVRTLSFSHDSQLLASASEDLFIDIVSSSL